MINTFTKQPLWFNKSASALSVVCCLLSFMGMQAQDNAVAWGEPFRVNRSDDHLGIVGSDGPVFYSARVKDDRGTSVFLDRYDIGKTLERTPVEVTLPGGDEGEHRFGGIARVRNGFILYSEFKNRKTNQYQFFGTALSNDGKPLYDPVLLHAIPFSEYRSEGYFDVYFSPDSSMFMTLYNLPFDRKASERFDLRVYTTDFEIVWQKNLEMPYEEGVVQLRNFAVTNQGDALMMSGWAPEKEFADTRFQRPQDGRYVLYHYNWQANKLKEYDVSLKDKSIVSVKLDLADSGDLVIAGFFSNDRLFSVSGTFLFILDLGAGAVKTASMIAFPKEFLMQFISERAVERGLDLQDVYLDYLHITGRGETILLGERYYITERVVTDPTTGRQTVEYIRNFDDILAVAMAPDGNLSWFTRVPKRQTTFGAGSLSSYAAYFNEKEIRIFFNDDPDNASVDFSIPGTIGKTYSDERNSILAEVVLDAASGTMQRRVLANNKETKYSLKPSICSKSGRWPIILGFEESRMARYAVLRNQ